MRHRGEAGFTSTWVLVLAMLIVVFGVAAFDVWRVFADQRALAAQADRAAAAGAQAIDEGAFADSANPRLVLLDGDGDGSAQRLALAQFDEGSTLAACEGGALPTGAALCGEIVVANPAPGAVTAPTVTVTLRREVKLSFFPTDQVVVATSTASPRYTG